MPRFAISLAAAATVAIGLSTAPAQAHDGWYPYGWSNNAYGWNNDAWREHEWRQRAWRWHEWREHAWRQHWWREHHPYWGRYDYGYYSRSGY